jgi:prevent-host-death family protein
MMTRMTALEAKNAFGQFLDAAQRAPVTVTKNGREVGAMFSKADLEKMGAAYLWPPLLESVRLGEVSYGEALLRQVTLNRRLEEAEADVAAGRVHVADEAFYDSLRAEIRNIAAR